MRERELSILEFPDPRLRKKSVNVECFDETLRDQAERMISAMRSADGVGLAAIQVGWPIRLIVMECSGSPVGHANEPMTLCNPKIVGGSGKSDIAEGCLSAPGIHEKLGRWDRVEAVWQTLSGEEARGAFEGLAAVCLQHELDHLDGKIFFEGLSPLKAARARERYFKLKKAK